MIKKIATNILLNIVKLTKINTILAGVPVIITNSQGRILLGKRKKNAPYYPDIWGLPGGLIDYKESSIETAKREIKEELGINIKITKKSNNIYEIFPSKECPFQTINIVYYATTNEKPRPKSETQEVKWFTPSEVKKIKLAYNHMEILKKEGIIK